MLVPRSRFAQKQIRELHASLGMLRECLRHVSEVAVDLGNVLMIGTPYIEDGRAGERRECQRADGNDP